MASTHRDRRLVLIRELMNGRVSEWLEFGARNDIAPIIAHAASEAFPHARDRNNWELLHSKSERRLRVLLDELDVVAEKLSHEGISLVALKNAGIARALFPCKGCCPMGDIDVLVSPARFQEAHKLVEECGFRIATRSTVEEATIEAALESGGAEYFKVVDDVDIWLELQWRPVAGRWIPRSQEPAADELIERSVPIEGSPLRLLQTEDNLLQVSLHTAKHSFIRAPGLRLHTDVDRIVSSAHDLNWDRFVERTCETSLKTPTYFSLAISAALLGADIPERVLARLKPGQLRCRLIAEWLRKRDLFEPGRPKFRRIEMAAFHAFLFDAPSDVVGAMIEQRPGIGYGASDGFFGERAVLAFASRTLDLMLRYERGA